MNKTLKDLLRPYIPLFLLVARSFLHKSYKKLLYICFRVSIDKNSKIYPLLKENWKNYKKDLYPKDRKMKILKNIYGLSTENIRFLINEVTRRFAKNGVYLEIGTFLGCSLLSAALFNYSTRCIGVDNFSEFNPKSENNSTFKKNLEKFNNPENIEFYNQDYKTVIPDLFSKEPNTKVNVYYYDGKHTYGNQLEGLNIILPHLSYKCVILVDDVNRRCVEEANKYFIKKNLDFKSVFKIKTEKSNSPDWGNGFEIITRGL